MEPGPQYKRAPERERVPWLKCPECGYDLHGIPEGTCPECGGWFDEAYLKHRHSYVGPYRDLAVFIVDRPWLVPTLALVCTILPVEHPGFSFGSRYPCWVPLSLWVLLLAWLSPERRRAYSARPWMLLLLALPMLKVMLDLLRFRLTDSEAVTAGVLPFALGTVMSIAAWRLARERSIVALGVILAGPFVVASGFIAASTWYDGGLWSPWEDPRKGYLHDQWPLRYDEAYTLAAMIAAPGLLIAGVTVVAAFRILTRVNPPAPAAPPLQPPPQAQP